MPTYIYSREDGSTFEIVQSMNDDALVVCPQTGMSVKRVITGGEKVQFKGYWPGKQADSDARHAKGLAKDPLYTTLPEYQDKKKDFDEMTGRAERFKPPRIYT